MNHELINFFYAVLSSGAGSAIYEGLKNILSVKQFDSLNKIYEEGNKEKFNFYVDELLKSNYIETQIIELQNKSIFDNAKIKAVGETSDIKIDVNSQEKKISIGKETEIKAEDGGKIQFKYSDK